MSTNLEVGIVGLPNVGKSTLFNAITKAGAEAANYPFCTIEPNVGIVEVPDPRIQVLTDMYNPKKTIPAVMRFVDIAGLVAGASKGEGWATNSSAISAKPMPSPKSSAALKIQTSPMSTAPSTHSRYRNDQHRTLPGRFGNGAETSRPHRQSRPVRR